MRVPGPARCATGRADSQRDDFTLPRVQALQAFRERPCLLASEREVSRTGRVIGQYVGVRRIQRYGFLHPLCMLAAQAVQRAVAHDGGHPRHGGGQVRAVVAGVAPDVDETFLQDVLGPILPDQDTQREPEQFRRASRIERTQRIALAQADALQQGGQFVGLASLRASGCGRRWCDGVFGCVVCGGALEGEHGAALWCVLHEV